MMPIFGKKPDKVMEKEKELEALLTVTESEQIEALEQSIKEAAILKSQKKLMDLTGDAGLDGLCMVSDDVTTIAEDKEITEILDVVLQKNQSLTYVAAGVKIAKLISLVIKNHRNELARILSVLTGETQEVILTYRVGLLVQMAKKALLQDADMLNLFKR